MAGLDAKGAARRRQRLTAMLDQEMDQLIQGGENTALYALMEDLRYRVEKIRLELGGAYRTDESLK